METCKEISRQAGRGADLECGGTWPRSITPAFKIHHSSFTLFSFHICGTLCSLVITDQPGSGVKPDRLFSSLNFYWLSASNELSLITLPQKPGSAPGSRRGQHVWRPETPRVRGKSGLP